jgi:hypothetical protein
LGRRVSGPAQRHPAACLHIDAGQDADACTQASKQPCLIPAPLSGLGIGAVASLATAASVVGKLRRRLGLGVARGDGAIRWHRAPLIPQLLSRCRSRLVWLLFRVGARAGCSAGICADAAAITPMTAPPSRAPGICAFDTHPRPPSALSHMAFCSSDTLRASQFLKLGRGTCIQARDPAFLMSYVCQHALH